MQQSVEDAVQLAKEEQEKSGELEGWLDYALTELVQVDRPLEDFFLEYTVGIYVLAAPGSGGSDF